MAALVLRRRRTTWRIEDQVAPEALCEPWHEASLVVGPHEYGRVAQAVLGSVVSRRSLMRWHRSWWYPSAGSVPPTGTVPWSWGSTAPPGCDTALDTAADIAAGAGAELLVVSAWETPRADHWSRISLADEEWRRETIEAARGEAQTLVGRAGSRARDATRP